MVRFWQRLGGGGRTVRPRRSGHRRNPFRPLLEELETRLVLSTLATNTDELRAAIASINGGTGPADNTIVLAPNTYSTEGDTVPASRGTFTISHNIILEAAPGAAPANVIIDGAMKDRVFDVTGAVTAEFDGLTIQHGAATGDGGGIRAETTGTVVLTNSVVTANTATGNGGGIAVSSATLVAAGHASVTLTNSVVSSNMASGGGGVFAQDADVTLDLSDIHDNTASGGGGGIDAVNVNGGGTVLLTDSTIDHNNAASGGGGIQTTAENLTINRSTISRNTLSGGDGGGILSASGGPGPATIAITNSTIADNSTGTGVFEFGGGIALEGSDSLTLTNVTVTLNTASCGGDGVYQHAGTATLQNTLVAKNSSADLSGTFTSQGHNLIGDAGSSTGFSDGVNNDQVGSDSSHLDPGLDPHGLQNNGGPTQTVALVPGSRAIDRGQDGVVGTDQRGVPRPQGAHTDIGAFEVQVPVFVPLVPAANPGAIQAFVFQGPGSPRNTALDFVITNPTPQDLTIYVFWGDSSRPQIIPLPGVGAGKFFFQATHQYSKKSFRQHRHTPYTIVAFVLVGPGGQTLLGGGFLEFQYFPREVSSFANG
jgi:hypothetical protein